MSFRRFGIRRGVPSSPNATVVAPTCSESLALVNLDEEVVHGASDSPRLRGTLHFRGLTRTRIEVRLHRTDAH